MSPVRLSPHPVRRTTIVLPTEHGGWAFVLVPLLLGVLVTPSTAGGWLSLATVSVFLVRQPLKLALGDWRRGKTYARTRWAAGYAVGFGLLALVAAGLAVLTTQHTFWLPLVLAIPLGVVQLAADLRRESRSLTAELAGAAALQMSGAMLGLAAGWPVERALALWLVLLVWATTSILYVRVRVRRAREPTISTAPVWLAHAVGLLVVSLLVGGELLPWIAVPGMLLLIVRAGVGLHPSQHGVRTLLIGLQEIGVSLLLVGLLAGGYLL
jgi:hypothetical protein